MAAVIVIAIVLVGLALAVWVRQRRHSKGMSGLWTSAPGEIEFAARLTQAGDELNGIARFRGPYTTEGFSVLGSIDGRGSVILSVTTPADLAGRVTFVGRLSYTGQLTGVLRSAGEGGRSITLRHQVTPSNSASEQMAEVPETGRRLDSFSGIWSSAKGDVPYLQLEVEHQDARVLGSALLATANGNLSGEITGTSGTAGVMLQLSSLGVTLELCAWPHSPGNWMLTNTGPGKIDEQFTLLLTRVREQDVFQHLYGGRWRGAGQTWAIDVALTFAPGDAEGMADVSPGSAALTLKGDCRNYDVVGGGVASPTPARR